MGKRRGNNEGTVYKRTDGKWAGAVTLGYNEQGNPKRRVVYGKTREEAAKRLTDLMDKFHKGMLADPSSVALKDFAKGWLERETVGKALNTRDSYAAEVGHALRFLGDVKLQAVRPMHIRKMLDRMASEGWTPKPSKSNPDPEPKAYTPRTQKMVLQRLKAVFQDALRLQIIYVNPCEAIKVKTPPSEPVGRVLEPGEMATLLKACDAHPMGILFRLLLDTGLRKGEALALTWADIDLGAVPPRLSVTKAWASSGRVSGGHLTKPKNPQSRRVVPIPPDTAERLRVLRSATVNTYGQGIQGLHLFGSPVNNTPFEPNAPNHALSRMCKRAGLKHTRPHDLRHTFGSTLLANGVKLEVVSKRMGHANPSITLNVYRHLLESEKFENVFEVTSTALAADEQGAASRGQGMPN